MLRLVACPLGSVIVACHGWRSRARGAAGRRRGEVAAGRLSLRLLLGVKVLPRVRIFGVALSIAFRPNCHIGGPSQFSLSVEFDLSLRRLDPGVSPNVLLSGLV